MPQKLVQNSRVFQHVLKFLDCTLERRMTHELRDVQVVQVVVLEIRQVVMYSASKQLYARIRVASFLNLDTQCTCDQIWTPYDISGVIM